MITKISQLSTHKHQRKLTRRREYNYNQTGAYFVTICTKEKTNVFGKAEKEKMVLNEPGKIANSCWIEIPEHFVNVEIDDAFTVMPNHVHGIVYIYNDKEDFNVYENENVLKQREASGQPVGKRHAFSLQKTGIL